MTNDHSLDFWNRKRDRLLAKMAKIGPFVDGSLVTIARTCGSPGCKCARGNKHKSRYLTYKALDVDAKPPRMKTQTVYIPVAIEEQVRLWVEEYQRLKSLTRELADVQKMIIRSYVKEKGRGHRRAK